LLKENNRGAGLRKLWRFDLERTDRMEKRDEKRLIKG
jgi:hypothetical protein